MEVLFRRHPWYTVLPLTAILGYLLTLTGAWQLVFLAGLVAGYLLKDARDGFLVGLAAGALAWGVPLGLAAIYYPLGDAAALLLSILGLAGGPVVVVFLVTLLVGALATGLGAALGAYLVALVRAAREELQEQMT